MADPLNPLRPYLDNAPPPLSVPYVAGVLGDHPSVYSRSPAMWNAAFASLGLPAAYVPCDVAAARLEPFLAACRTASGLLGLNVTVPYKEQVMPFLDAHSDEARAVGAVNLIARSPDGLGRLIGSNTDVAGVGPVLRRLCAGLPGSAPEAVVVLGAGGAARAVAAALVGAFPQASLWMVARSPERAHAVAERLAAQQGSGGAGGPGGGGDAGGGFVRVSPVGLEALESILPEVDLVVNATPVGMAGPVPAGGGVTWLEPFSALAPADPPAWESPASEPDTSPGGPTRSGPSSTIVTNRARTTSPPHAPPRPWVERAWPLIAASLGRSLRRALLMRPRAVVLDLVYAPPETVMLKHARWTGHAAANGLEVLVGQAVAGFMRLCAPLLGDRDPAEAERTAAAAMAGVAA